MLADEINIFFFFLKGGIHLCRGKSQAVKKKKKIQESL